MSHVCTPYTPYVRGTGTRNTDTLTRAERGHAECGHSQTCWTCSDHQRLFRSKSYFSSKEDTIFKRGIFTFYSFDCFDPKGIEIWHFEKQTRILYVRNSYVSAFTLLSHSVIAHPNVNCKQGLHLSLVCSHWKWLFYNNRPTSCLPTNHMWEFAELIKCMTPACRQGHRLPTLGFSMSVSPMISRQVQ